MLESVWKKIIRRKSLSLWALPALLLWLCSFIYRLAFLIRRATAAEPVTLSVPVISIGNISVGGSGKTPLVAFLSQDLQQCGVRVGVVLSGYGRTITEPILASGYKVEKMDVSATGDEAMLLATLLPDAVFSIHAVKAEGARVLAESGKVDIIVVDDGFQHFGLARDIDIVTYDAAVEARHLKSFPYGILREPIKALKRADVIIITRAKFAQDLNRIKDRLKLISPKAELYSAGFETTNLVGSNRSMSVKYIEDKSVFLFAGIGNFESLKRQVTMQSGDLDYALELSDHQEYDQTLLREIKEQAGRYDSDVILTTLKDWVKLWDFDFDREIYYLDLTVDLDPGEEKLIAYLQEKLNFGRRND
ncbi:MAG: tetraacyldisaccharide 4'-kinase [Candidatus Zixiibacteriota bacterium]|nr:MAG: tetraacyldisaccharide 4'-kinase [candidate division Zixibacteria bacterium]